MRQHNDMILVYVDIDDCPRIQDKYGAYSVPTVLAFVDGREVDRFIGARNEAGVQQFLAQIPTPH